MSKWVVGTVPKDGGPVQVETYGDLEVGHWVVRKDSSTLLRVMRLFVDGTAEVHPPPDPKMTRVAVSELQPAPAELLDPDRDASFEARWAEHPITTSRFDALRQVLLQHAIPGLEGRARPRAFVADNAPACVLGGALTGSAFVRGVDRLGAIVEEARWAEQARWLGVAPGAPPVPALKQAVRVVVFGHPILVGRIRGSTWLALTAPRVDDSPSLDLISEPVDLPRPIGLAAELEREVHAAAATHLQLASGAGESPLEAVARCVVGPAKIARLGFGLTFGPEPVRAVFQRIERLRTVAAPIEGGRAVILYGSTVEDEHLCVGFVVENRAL